MKCLRRRDDDFTWPYISSQTLTPRRHQLEYMYMPCSCSCSCSGLPSSITIELGDEAAATEPTRGCDCICEELLKVENYLRQPPLAELNEDIFATI
ncbi:unnamed protein product [Eruca vesicaria subsp. sativa]|uniref:Uncharacterized protein n=1 Tax=Eruca vesicaria subsp. sativa TaxID=29727 RepID=A0ABC8JHT0_ERUVS|nr:unnamed protein product [Eruca vesicaria subsp. sativa]